MASFKKTLMKQGLKLMSDPRVLKLMQDERVMKAVMAAVAIPGQVQTFTAEQVERFAKSMALATEDEVKDLRRTVRRLEEEVSRMRTDRGADDEVKSERDGAARRPAAAKKRASKD